MRRRTNIVGVASVIDGDTIDIHGQRIRFFGIDAPESGQSCEDARGEAYRCGQKAALALDELLSGAPCAASAATSTASGASSPFAGSGARMPTPSWSSVASPSPTALFDGLRRQRRTGTRRETRAMGRRFRDALGLPRARALCSADAGVVLQGLPHRQSLRKQLHRAHQDLPPANRLRLQLAAEAYAPPLGSITLNTRETISLIVASSRDSTKFAVPA